MPGNRTSQRENSLLSFLWQKVVSYLGVRCPFELRLLSSHRDRETGTLSPLMSALPFMCGGARARVGMGQRGANTSLSQLRRLCCAALSRFVMSNFLWPPLDCSPPDSSVHGDSPDRNTGEGCHALLQGIFPTQGSNPGLTHCRWILYRLSHQGNPRKSKIQADQLNRLDVLRGCFLGSAGGKETACRRMRLRDTGLIPGLSRSPGEEHGTHSSILAWRIPWTEEPSGLQSTGSQRVYRTGVP